MDSGFLMMTLGFSVFGFLITYMIIQFAVNGSKAGKHAEYQTKLLVKIAQKHGVTNEEINECYQ